MGEYEPDDSRDVTLSAHQAPGEPPRDEQVAAKDAQDARRDFPGRGADVNQKTFRKGRRPS